MTLLIGCFSMVLAGSFVCACGIGYIELTDKKEHDIMWYYE